MSQDRTIKAKTPELVGYALRNRDKRLARWAAADLTRAFENKTFIVILSDTISLLWHDMIPTIDASDPQADAKKRQLDWDFGRIVALWALVIKNLEYRDLFLRPIMEGEHGHGDIVIDAVESMPKDQPYSVLDDATGVMHMLRRGMMGMRDTAIPRWGKGKRRTGKPIPIGNDLLVIVKILRELDKLPMAPAVAQVRSLLADGPRMPTAAFCACLRRDQLVDDTEIERIMDTHGESMPLVAGAYEIAWAFTAKNRREYLRCIEIYTQALGDETPDQSFVYASAPVSVEISEPKEPS